MTTIVNGPSKLDLITSLAYSCNEQRYYVYFTLQNGDVKKVNIASMGIEDGSGESWNLKGYAQSNCNGAFSKFVSIYYRTDTRKGNFNI